MRSESARRILSKTPQDVKDKVIAYADEVARKSKHTNTMTKIEQLENEIFKQVSECRLVNDTLEAYKAAIREQVVIDALPSERDIIEHEFIVTDEYDAMMSNHQTADGFIGWQIGMFKMRTIATQRLTTREEVERPYVELLKEIKEYGLLSLNHESIITRINSLTDGK